MIRRIAFIFVVFLVCGICTSATAADSVLETDPIPEIFTLHHFLGREDVKNWMTNIEVQVAETDKFLQNKKDMREIAVARLKDGFVTYQCDMGQECGNNNSSTGYLVCDPYAYENDTWAIYPTNYGSYQSRSIKHNINLTSIKNYWMKEISNMWADPTYFKGTVLDGKKIDRWCGDEYQNGDRYICYYLAPCFSDSNTTWKFTIALQSSREPDRIEEGCFYRDIGSTSIEISVRVIHDRYVRIIDYNDFVLGPIVYHY